MVSVTITRLVSDLSGTEIDDTGGETVDFGYRGVSYSIDLTQTEASEFDEAIGKFIDNATRKAGRKRSSGGGGSAKTGDYNAKDVRVWAKSRQIDVPDRGRIPSDVLSRYLAEGRS